MNSDELIKEYCKELRLGKNLYENYSKIKAAYYADFLVNLLKLEMEHREVARRNRNLSAAGLFLEDFLPLNSDVQAFCNKAEK